MADVYKPCSSPLHGSTSPLDETRCKAGVWSKERWARYSQCSRKAGADGWCKTHHPETVAQRISDADARYEKATRSTAMGWFGEKWMAALIKIADGDNDPRQTAKEALEGCRYAVRKDAPNA